MRQGKLEDQGAQWFPLGGGQNAIIERGGEMARNIPTVQNDPLGIFASMLACPDREKTIRALKELLGEPVEPYTLQQTQSKKRVRTRKADGRR